MEAISLNPRPSMLMESLRSIGYTLDTALADVVDNSISAGARRISIRFLWANGDPWIAVLDNGRGMKRDELLEAMRFGSVSPLAKRSEDDLGRFGLGMKTASISQCRLLTVASMTGRVVAGCTWDMDDLVRRNSPDWTVLVHDEKSLAGMPILRPLVDALQEWGQGTAVCWRSIDGLFPDKSGGQTEPRFSELMDRARLHLQLVFHRFLSPDPGRTAVAMDFNGSPLSAADPFGPRHPARQELPQETIMIAGERVEVQPYILPHHSKIPRSEYEAFGGEEGYLQSQGFYLYRNRRLIVKGTWFRLIRKEVLNKLIRVRVDIPTSLDSLWRIDVKKAEAEPPESALKELRKVIRRIEGAGQRVFTKRAARVYSGPAVAVWRREVFEGKIRYTLNEEHPLIRGMLEDKDPARAARARACLQLVSTMFPADVYFSDAAGDDVDFGPPLDDPAHLKAMAELITALRGLGFAGDDLRQQLALVERPPVSVESLEMLLTEMRHA